MPTGKAAQGGTKSWSSTRTPIERFSIDFDCDMGLAVLLVDRYGNEAQTEMNIKLMVKYLQSVWDKSRNGDYA